jgi:hypothetical protein
MSITSPAPDTRESTLPTGTVQGRAVLDRAVAAMTAKRRVEVEVLEATLAWAQAHTVTDDEEDLVAGWRSDAIHAPGSVGALFGDRALPIAGAGTPFVAEFAVMELAAVLDCSHEATLALIGDVLDLAHRLPRTWALVKELRVPVRLGREAARASRDLDVAAAGHADRLLAWQPRRLNPHRIGVLVHEARLYADPDRAIADHDHAMGARRVECRYGEGAPGTGEVFMVLDEADTMAFDHTVSTMAATMRSLGHPGDLGVRRAHAVGLLADPQKALDLLAVTDIADPDRVIDPERDPAVCVAEDAAYATANPFRRPALAGSDHCDARGESGEVVLVVHVTDRDLLAGNPAGGSIDSRGVARSGVARSDKLGPLLLGRLQSWLRLAGNVTIKPVLDLDPHAPSIPPVDAHDPPARMAAAVRLRDETCIYPRCGRPAVACDLDHRRVRPPRPGRPIGPDQPREPGPAVSPSPPGQDLRRVHLPAPGRRVLRVDPPQRQPRHHRPTSSTTHTTSPQTLTAPPSPTPTGGRAIGASGSAEMRALLTQPSLLREPVSGCGPTLPFVGDDMTTPTGWDQREDATLDSPVLGAIALVIAALSALCALTYFYSVLSYLGAAIAVPLGVLSRGIPRSRGLGTGAVALAAVACVVATAVLFSVDG